MPTRLIGNNYDFAVNKEQERRDFHLVHFHLQSAEGVASISVQNTLGKSSSGGAGGRLVCILALCKNVSLFMKLMDRFSIFARVRDIECWFDLELN